MIKLKIEATDGLDLRQQLIALLGDTEAGTANTVETTGNSTATTDPPKEKAKRKTTATTEDPKKEETPKETGSVTLETMRAELSPVISEFPEKYDAMIAILEKFGVGSLSALPEAQYNEFWAEVKSKNILA